ncbi:hypothetical protein CYLTODRAFT_418477 [Cylindrobasidium torrendii FP15055 ss-10]|uniref:MARVEL domain-containing protein n=1 Tax=Cylindrobasidium torrendii FP15055 ss-10 TaxID=1314674 RepID=A0A0D7BMT2_9AGAR|nr:hypothetical protein CYLTODRAFT_418477 [Cylindrobasidium torrendii FP15055 ss-10]
MFGRLPLFRLVALSTASVFSLIVLGLAAHVISATSTVGFYYTFNALSVATAALTLVTLPVMLVIDLLRSGAFTSMIVVELVTVGVLWVLWLASAALTADSAQYLASNCSAYYYDADIRGCSEIKATEAFDFLIWIILLAYWAFLLTSAILHANKGNKGVWYGSVASGASSSVATNEHGMAEKNVQPTV